MGLRFGSLKTASVDIDRSSEFTGDDIDQYSSLVDLGDNFTHAMVHFGTGWDEGRLTVYTQLTGEIDEVPKICHEYDAASATSVAVIMGTNTGGVSVIVPVSGQYLRVRSSAAQSVDTWVQVRGVMF